MPSRTVSENSRRSSSSTRRRLISLLLLLVVGLVVLWVSGGLVALANLSVRQALDKGKDSVAERRLAYARALSGSSGETAFLEARLARHRGDFQTMARLLASARRLGYSEQRIEREEMLAKAQVGQLDDALESKLNQWLAEAGPDTREICAAYANGLAASSRIADAQKILQAWQDDYPSDPRPAFRLGRISDHQRRPEDALKQYEIAYQRDPEYLPAVYSMARVFVEQRQVDNALAVLEATPETENSPPLQTLLAQCKKAQSQTDEAKQILEQVLALPVETIAEAYRDLESPTERLVAAVELGTIESAEGDFAAAQKWLQKAIEFNPRDLEARYAYAVALRGLGRKEEAEEEFEYVKRTREALASVNTYWDRISNNPRDIEARLALAKILLEHESKRNGLYWVKSILEYEPDNAEAAELLRKYADPSGSASASHGLPDAPGQSN